MRRYIAAVLAVLPIACSSTTGSKSGQDRPADVVDVTRETSMKAVQGRTVRILGKAVNAKLAPAVDGPILVYCLDLSPWPEAVLGKQVVVTGVIERTGQFRARTDPATGAISQGTDIDVFVLRQAKYSLAP